MKILAALTAACLCLPLCAAAQTNNCGPRPAVVERLTEGYGETRHAIGLAANNQVVEFWGAEATGTWTLLVTLPDGRSCIVASGAAFERLNEALPPSGNDA